MNQSTMQQQVERIAKNKPVDSRQIGKTSPWMGEGWKDEKLNTEHMDENVSQTALIVMSNFFYDNMRIIADEIGTTMEFVVESAISKAIHEREDTVKYVAKRLYFGKKISNEKLSKYLTKSEMEHFIKELD